MSSLSDFYRIKLYNTLGDLPSQQHGLTEYGIKEYVDNSIANISGTNVVNETEILYDSFLATFYGDAYPTGPNTTGKKYAARFAKHVWNTWETNYSKCKVRLTCVNSGEIFNAGPFDTITDLYSWINTVVPNNGTEVTDDTSIQVYDIKSGDIPGIQKIYGINSLYLRILGSRNGKKSSIRTAYNTGDTDSVKTIIMLLSQYFTDTGFLPFPITSSHYDTNGENSRRILWVSGNKRNIYGLPKIGSYISLSSTIPVDVRHWWDFDNIASIPQASADQAHIIQSMCYLVDYGGTYECLNETEITSVMYGYQNYPICVVYLVKHSDNPDAWSFYIKPVGINTVYVDWFDQSLYRLEAVGFNKDRQPKLKYCPCQVGQQYSDFVGNRTQVKKDIWMVTDSQYHMENTGFLTPRSVKFRLRRLSDGKLGPYSHATIKPILRTRNAYIKWMVC